MPGLVIAPSGDGHRTTEKIRATQQLRNHFTCCNLLDCMRGWLRNRLIRLSGRPGANPGPVITPSGDGYRTHYGEPSWLTTTTTRSSRI